MISEQMLDLYSVRRKRYNFSLVRRRKDRYTFLLNRRDFGERVLSIFFIKIIMAAIFNFHSRGELERERNLRQDCERRSKGGRGEGIGLTFKLIISFLFRDKRSSPISSRREKSVKLGSTIEINLFVRGFPKAVLNQFLRASTQHFISENYIQILTAGKSKGKTGTYNKGVSDG